jgi:SOS-response transcriptional repressor LexA
MKENDAAKNIASTSKFSGTLEKLMKLRGINMSQLHKSTAVPLTTINRMVNESSVNPTISTLIPIADYFGVTLNQLMGIDPLETNTSGGMVAKKSKYWKEIPIINWDQTINWDNNSAKHVLLNTISTDANISDNSFALIIKDSNLEGFMPNSVIVVDTCANYEHGDYVIIAKAEQHRASLKQILMDDDLTYIRPLNKNYQTQIMDNSYKIIGVVIQIRMDRK